MKNQSPENISTYLLVENGHYPNNGKLPLLIVGRVFEDNRVSAERFEQLFSAHSWPAAWRNGLYNVHHYHSTAHEALGIYSGWVEACFGGPGGPVVKAETGDVIIIPAGVSHCNVGQSADFRVVGAYPQGQVWDMKYGTVGERPDVDRIIAGVALPTADPVFGTGGPLETFWR
ncbi:MAG: hypothetical protein V2I35_07060 [Desulfocapsaceae bacterium]|nr:hypothetical protein [Desulfocapsaceae bacterium]